MLARQFYSSSEDERPHGFLGKFLVDFLSVMESKSIFIVGMNLCFGRMRSIKDVPVKRLWLPHDSTSSSPR